MERVSYPAGELIDTAVHLIHAAGDPPLRAEALVWWPYAGDPARAIAAGRAIRLSGLQSLLVRL